MQALGYVLGAGGAFACGVLFDKYSTTFLKSLDYYNNARQFVAHHKNWNSNMCIQETPGHKKKIAYDYGVKVVQTCPFDKSCKENFSIWKNHLENSNLNKH